MNTMYKTRVGRIWSGTQRGRKGEPSDKKKAKRTKYDIIHKLRRSVFGQSFAVSHRLTTNNYNLT